MIRHDWPGNRILQTFCKGEVHSDPIYGRFPRQTE
jgi:hypothetical protein